MPRKPGNRPAATKLIRVSPQVFAILTEQMFVSPNATYDDALRGILRDAGYELQEDSPPSGEE